MPYDYDAENPCLRWVRAIDLAELTSEEKVVLLSLLAGIFYTTEAEWDKCVSSSCEVEALIERTGLDFRTLRDVLARLHDLRIINWVRDRHGNPFKHGYFELSYQVLRARSRVAHPFDVYLKQYNDHDDDPSAAQQ